MRTATFFLLLVFSIAASVLSIQVGRHLGIRFGAWNGALLGVVLYAVVMGTVFHFLPDR